MSTGQPTAQAVEQGEKVKTLRTTGLGALAVALCLACVAAAPASAESYFVGDLENTTWKGDNVGTVKFSFPSGTGSAVSFTCNVADLAGSQSGATAESVGVTPEFSECTTSGWKSSIEANGCEFVFHAPTDNPPEGVVDIANCESPMNFAAPYCNVSVGNQEDVGYAEYKNVTLNGKDGLDIDVTLTNITFTSTSGCGLLGGPSKGGTYENGLGAGSWEVGGYGGETQVNLKLKLNPEAFGLGASAATVGIPPQGKRILQIEFPSIGEGVRLTCNELSHSGEAEDVTTSEITLLPSYSKCLFLFFNTALEVNGCDELSLPISGGLGIAGESCASEPMTVKSVLGCSVTIGPQKSVGGLDYANNEESGTQRRVLVEGSGEGVDYTVAGTCPGGVTGEFDDGVLTTQFPLSAADAEGEPAGIWVY